jgi:hypothetical protein
MSNRDLEYGGAQGNCFTQYVCYLALFRMYSAFSYLALHLGARAWHLAGELR